MYCTFVWPPQSLYTLPPPPHSPTKAFIYSTFLWPPQNLYTLTTPPHCQDLHILYFFLWSHQNPFTLSLPSPVTYYESFGADQYINQIHKGTTMVGVDRVHIQNCASKCSKNALPGPVCS